MKVLCNLIILTSIHRQTDSIFLDVGRYAPMTHGSISTKVDFTDIENSYMTLSKTLDNLSAFYLQNGKNDTSDLRINHSIMNAASEKLASAKRTITETKEMLGLNRERPKRFLGAMLATVSLALGIRNAVAIESLKNSVQLHFQKEKAILHAINRRIDQLEERMDKKFREIEQRELLLQFEMHLVEFVSILTDFKQDVLKILAGRFSPGLITKNGIEETFENLKNECLKMGLHIPIGKAIDLFNLPAALRIEKGEVRFIIAVPIMKATYRLYKHIDLAPVINQTSASSMIIAEKFPSHQYIAVNNEKTFYLPLTADDLSRCHQIDDITGCDHPQNVLMQDFHRTCIGSLLKGYHASAWRTCDLRFKEITRPVAKEISGSRFLVYTPFTVNMEEQCFGEKPKIKDIRQPYELVEIRPGCSGLIDDLKLESIPTIEINGTEARTEIAHRFWEQTKEMNETVNRALRYWTIHQPHKKSVRSMTIDQLIEKQNEEIVPPSPPLSLAQRLNRWSWAACVVIASALLTGISGISGVHCIRRSRRPKGGSQQDTVVDPPLTLSIDDTRIEVSEREI